MTRSTELVLKILVGSVVTAAMIVGSTGSDLFAQAVTPPPGVQTKPPAQQSVPVPPEGRATVKQSQPNAVAREPAKFFTLGADGKIYYVGDACTRKSDNKPGVTKRDACGRWYCSLPGAKDIIELRPNMAAEMNCVWRLYGTHCRCGSLDAAAKSKTP